MYSLTVSAALPACMRVCVRGLQMLPVFKLFNFPFLFLFLNAMLTEAFAKKL